MLAQYIHSIQLRSQDASPEQTCQKVSYDGGEDDHTDVCVGRSGKLQLSDRLGKGLVDDHIPSVVFSVLHYFRLTH